MSRAKKAPHRQASDAAKRNATTWRPGQSGNPAGKGKLLGKPSGALVKAAREFSEEAFAIVQDIARTGSDEGERLRAARLALEIASAADEEKADEEANTIRIIYDDRYQASTGYGPGKDARPALTVNYHELDRRKALAKAYGTTVEEIERIEKEAEAARSYGGTPPTRSNQ